jgi:hypothetical protein
MYRHRRLPRLRREGTARATEWSGGHMAVASEIGDARAVEKRYGLRGRYPPALVVI